MLKRFGSFFAVIPRSLISTSYTGNRRDCDFYDEPDKDF